MIEILIPGGDALRLLHGVFDFNGTLACDGRLHDGVAERLRLLGAKIALHVVTGDTMGTARDALRGLPVSVHVLAPERQAEAKRAFLATLNAIEVVAVGNGRNDRELLAHAGLAVAVLGHEGCAAEALRAADVVCASIGDALDLLLHPQRLVATLRS